MNSILLKIIIPFVALMLIVVGALAVFNYISTSQVLTEAANQSLLAASRQTANSVRNYLSNTSDFLEFEADSRNEMFVNYLGRPAGQRRNSPQETLVLEQITKLANGRGIVAYALLDRDGKVWLSTDTPVAETDALPLHFGMDKADPLYLNKVMLTGVPYVSPVIFDPNRSEPVIYFAARISDNQGIPIGLLVTLREASILQEIAVLSTGLAGEDSFAVIVDNNGLRLAHGLDQASLYTFIAPLNPEGQGGEGLQQLIETWRAPASAMTQPATNYTEFAAGLANLVDTPFFETEETSLTLTRNSAAGVYIAEADWTVVFLQPQSVFLAPVNTQTRNTVFLALSVAIIAVVAAALIGRAITRPIRALTVVAEKVATGDLAARADTTSQDELGTLAMAFNVMNARQRQMLEELEQRVQARTAELAHASELMRHRASQLQTVSEVARVIASEQEQSLMLPLITQTISERFGFYHAGIFLLDDAGEYAVLRAANSEGGKRMLARNHKLRVGQVGIIGFVTSSGQPRVALDVGKDAVFFDNPDLPNTRSEIGLPLKVGGRIIGALDAQSTEQSAFSQEDIALLSTLADQVAIAIENARLFSETRRALENVQASQRAYLRTEWSRLAENRPNIGYEYRQGEMITLDEASLASEALPKEKKGDGRRRGKPAPESSAQTGGIIDSQIWSQLEEVAASTGFIIQRVQTAGDGSAKSETQKGSGPTLRIPIILRGEILGVINFSEMNPDRVWSEDEISLAKVIAEQVGLALENARLIEETQRRAEREHLVAEITTRLRSSNDPQVILQTAAQELRQVLRSHTAQVIVQPISDNPTGSSTKKQLVSNQPKSTEE